MEACLYFFLAWKVDKKRWFRMIVYGKMVMTDVIGYKMPVGYGESVTTTNSKQYDVHTWLVEVLLQDWL